MVVFGQSRFLRANVVVVGQKAVVFRQRGCIGAKVVVLG